MRSHLWLELGGERSHNLDQPLAFSLCCHWSLRSGDGIPVHFLVSVRFTWTSHGGGVYLRLQRFILSRPGMAVPVQALLA